MAYIKTTSPHYHIFANWISIQTYFFGLCKKKKKYDEKCKKICKKKKYIYILLKKKPNKWINVARGFAEVTIGFNVKSWPS